MGQTTLEEDRFVKYQEIYNANRPKDPVIPVAPTGAPTTQARSTKTMQTRRGNYGKTGLTEQGRSNLQNK